MRRLLFIAFAASCGAFAQVPPRDAGWQADPPEITRDMCEALAGTERQLCLAQLERQPPEESVPRPGAPRTCDHLLGPEKEICLKQGGSVKAGTGSTRPLR